jgi:hypothetical protein
MSRMEQLIEVTATTDKGKLSKTNMERLQDALPAKLYERHR